MNRRFRTWMDAPKRVVVRVAYQVVALLVTIAGWISRQWRSVTHGSMKLLSYMSRKRENTAGAYSKGKRPKEPRVLGVVLFQRAFRAQEDQALSRLLTWYVLYVWCLWFVNMGIYEQCGTSGLHSMDLSCVHCTVHMMGFMYI